MYGDKTWWMLVVQAVAPLAMLTKAAVTPHAHIVYELTLGLARSCGSVAKLDLMTRAT